MEAYIHAPAPDALIQLAVLHATRGVRRDQPFLDGNGQLGRLIIPLFLKSKGLLSAPASICQNISKATVTNITTACWRCRVMATGQVGAGSFLRAIIEQAGTNQTKHSGDPQLYAKNWMVETAVAICSGGGRWTGSSAAIFVASDFVTQSDIPGHDSPAHSSIGAGEWSSARDQVRERQTARCAGLPRALEHLRGTGGVLTITYAHQIGLWIEIHWKLRHSFVSHK